MNLTGPAKAMITSSHGWSVGLITKNKDQTSLLSCCDSAHVSITAVNRLFDSPRISSRLSVSSLFDACNVSA